MYNQARFAGGHGYGLALRCYLLVCQVVLFHACWLRYSGDLRTNCNPSLGLGTHAADFTKKVRSTIRFFNVTVVFLPAVVTRLILVRGRL
jgi:hypothetical protein